MAGGGACRWPATVPGRLPPTTSSAAAAVRARPMAVAGPEASPLAHAQRRERSGFVRFERRPDVQAALAAGQLVVLLGQPPAGAEERALDDRSRHAHLLGDLPVGEALELA